MTSGTNLGQTAEDPSVTETKRPRRIISIGECMMEMADRGDGTMSMAYAGDTLNTAVYLARINGPALAVDYVTALGDDPYSDAMVAFWKQEGISTDWVARLPGPPGPGQGHSLG